jgi:hypothetical protein
MTRDDGLWLFVAATVTRIGGLTFDYALIRCGYPTITDFARRHDWAALAILVFELAGYIGLAYHLLNGKHQ